MQREKGTEVGGGATEVGGVHEGVEEVEDGAHGRAKGGEEEVDRAAEEEAREEEGALYQCPSPSGRGAQRGEGERGREEKNIQQNTTRTGYTCDFELEFNLIQSLKSTGLVNLVLSYRAINVIGDNKIRTSPQKYRTQHVKRKHSSSGTFILVITYTPIFLYY